MMRFEVRRGVSRVIFVLVLSLIPAFARAESDVPKWATHEIAFSAGESYSNGYAKEPSFTATFRGPEGVTKTVAGFWDGGNTFKVRFTPTAEGVWSYKTNSSDAALNQQTGSLNCVPASGESHGFLRVDANHPYSFVWDDGTRYYMCGQTYYDWIASALVNSNWKESVDKSLAYGLNKVRMGVYAQVADVILAGGSMPYPDAQPYAGSMKSPDRDVLNLAYWRKLDEMVEYMGSRGMVADLIVTNPYANNRMFGTAEQNDRFVRYVTARYAAYPNVIWCMCNEWQSSSNDSRYGGPYRQKKADFERMGLLVCNMDPWTANGRFRRVLSIHPGTYIDFDFFASSWPTYAINQWGEFNDTSANGDEWGNASIVHLLGHYMPVANDEYGYMGQDTVSQKFHIVMTRAVLRNTIWGIAAAGGYGSAGCPNSLTGDWIEKPGEYGDIKRMVDLFTTKGIEYWKMSSQNDLVTAGNRAYVLAEPGRQYVIYAAVGGTFAVKLAPGNYAAYRYDPQTGVETSLGQIAGGGSHSFTMPNAEDWVVYLVPVPKQP